MWSRPPAFADGAAGLVPTADDLLAFARMLLRGGAPVLTADAVAEMTRDQLTPGQKAAGGLGRGFFDIVLTQRMFETAEPPAAHHALRDAACAAFA